MENISRRNFINGVGTFCTIIAANLLVGCGGSSAANRQDVNGVVAENVQISLFTTTFVGGSVYYSVETRIKMKNISKAQITLKADNFKCELEGKPEDSLEPFKIIKNKADRLDRNTLEPDEENIVCVGFWIEKEIYQALQKNISYSIEVTLTNGNLMQKYLRKVKAYAGGGYTVDNIIGPVEKA